MSETLVGVLIGGLIASIAPIANLYFESKKWKRDSQLEYLKQERERLSTLFEDTLDELANAMIENSYSSKMTSEITILMPKEVSEKFMSFMDEKDKTESNCKTAYLGIAVEMKKCLKDIDDKISNLIGIK